MVLSSRPPSYNRYVYANVISYPGTIVNANLLNDTAAGLYVQINGSMN